MTSSNEHRGPPPSPDAVPVLASTFKASFDRWSWMHRPAIVVGAAVLLSHLIRIRHVPDGLGIADGIVVYGVTLAFGTLLGFNLLLMMATGSVMIWPVVALQRRKERKKPPPT